MKPSVITGLVFLVVLPFTLPGCTKEDPIPEKKLHTTAITNIVTEIAAIENLQDPVLQAGRILQFWDTLAAKKRIPWISNDTIVFLYKSSASAVHVAGDMTRWSLMADYQCKKLGNSEIWYLMKTFPADARLDYKMVENSSVWKLDPENPKKQLSGFGYNSAFSMPSYDSSKYVIPRKSIVKGKLSESLTLSSNYLNRPVRYWIYSPAGYENLNSLPAVYVVDGQEYKAEGMGSMITVLDNLIAEKLIEPIISVFVDPINPVTGSNQRAELFLNNPDYAGFFKNELVPLIDKTCKTENNPGKRAILGTSYGGNCAVYFGYQIPDVFKLIAPQSPAFSGNTLSLYAQSSSLSLKKVFITTGVIHDTEANADRLEQILKNQQVPYRYIKVNEGHSWGNWSALLDDILVYFFGG